MRDIFVDESLWPVARFTLRSNPSMQDWSEMFDCYKAFYTRGERFYVITDGRRLSDVPDAPTRALLGRLANEHEPQSKRWIITGAVIVQSRVVRGAMTALTWLAPPKYRLIYVDSLHDAFDDVVERFAIEQKEVPAGILEALSDVGAS